jgi:hypothetical protein
MLSALSAFILGSDVAVDANGEPDGRLAFRANGDPLHVVNDIPNVI